MLMMLLYYLALLMNRNALDEGQISPAVGLWFVHAIFLIAALFYVRRLGNPVET
jgi:lipopolysaccharide export LptBFGC system permease protein LptF